MLAKVKGAISILFVFCRFQRHRLENFDKSLSEIEGAFYSWRFELTGNPDDPMSDISIVRRWRDRKLDKRKPIPWHARPKPKRF
ncbi:hypothetical protein PsB1_1494 [Candidatus Phycosocius spiralis]|uniref:Uncharacterized protein n=1 Tax=Candidatus Phycosocius spiralis TaxID=2815099 RepID=A0ABQ4PWM0_9PROT|nr:hypothetical protein PsB1_1494 [Candidatus Phycosocius spiralis]